MVDHILNRINPVLHREMELMVHRPQILRHFFPRLQVRRALQEKEKKTKQKEY